MVNEIVNRLFLRVFECSGICIFIQLNGANMKKIAMTFMLFFVLTESHARDYEKWWWEIGETAIASG